MSDTTGFDPAEMALRGRIGAFVQHSRHDPRETTAAARASFLARFEREVDPDGVLPVEERQRRAEAARRAYFARLALKSAQKRGKRATSWQRRASAPKQSPVSTESAS
jgi:hypothetical protein